jgi:putative DNA primase/helicase
MSLPAKKMQSVSRGATMGAAIQLQQPQNGRLAIAEGIETALAITKLKGWPCWAGVSAAGLRGIQLPEATKHVLIGVDRDESGTGQRVALGLIEALKARGLKVDIALPDTIGWDWADVAEVAA